MLNLQVLKFAKLFIVKGKHALSSGGDETKVFISYWIIKFLSWFNIHLAKVYIPNNLHTTQTCPSVYSLLKAGHRRPKKATYIIIIDDIKIPFLNLQLCSQGLRGVGRCKTLETRLINMHSTFSFPKIQNTLCVYPAPRAEMPTSRDLKSEDFCHTDNTPPRPCTINYIPPALLALSTLSPPQKKNPLSFKLCFFGESKMYKSITKPWNFEIRSGVKSLKYRKIQSVFFFFFRTSGNPYGRPEDSVLMQETSG